MITTMNLRINAANRYLLSFIFLLASFFAIGQPIKQKYYRCGADRSVAATSSKISSSLMVNQTSVIVKRI